MTKHKYKIYLISATIGIIILGYILNLVSTTEVTFNAENVTIQCPNWQNYMQVLEEWSADFNADNPNATDEEYRLAWYDALENNNCEQELPKCPTDAESFAMYWNGWSADYLTYHPEADVDTQMDEWNIMMTQNDCGDEWIDPLDDLIADYLESTSTVSE